MKAIGMVEYKTVSSGIKAADLIVKTAEVELLEAQTVCPGKFIILFTGDLSAIRVSVDAAVKTYPESLIDSFVLGNPHESLYRALHCTAEVDTIQALGVIETFTGASAIVAADHAAKTAEVTVFEVRLCRGMCGKSYVLLTGSVAAVTEAVESSAGSPRGRGCVCWDYAVIPSRAEGFCEDVDINVFVKKIWEKGMGEEDLFLFLCFGKPARPEIRGGGSESRARRPRAPPSGPL